MNLAGVLLDLDDTLYPERTYFESGVAAVADWVASRVGHQVLPELRDDIERHGREGFLDRIPVVAGMTESAWRYALLHVYRSHSPSLDPFDAARSFLASIRHAGAGIGIVTDGKSIVQWNKVRGLRLTDSVDIILCTDDIDTPKPSVHAFEAAAALLGVQPDDCAYIADDPCKDFIGPRKLGMRTVRVIHELDWPLAGPVPFDGADADHVTTSLEEALPILLA